MTAERRIGILAALGRDSWHRPRRVFSQTSRTLPTTPFAIERRESLRPLGLSRCFDGLLFTSYFASRLPMHASELLSVAAIIADSATALIRSPLSATSHVHNYWSASRERLDCWGRSFSNSNGNSDEGRVGPAPLSELLEEILYSEVLTRVWAAATLSYDAHHNTQSVSPVGRSIFLGHQESRNRTLLAILTMHDSRPNEGRRLNVLRQKCERWTDMFLAYFPRSAEVERLAFDVDRCNEFAVDLVNEGRQRDAMQSLTMASLGTVAKRASLSVAVNAELNSRIASAVLACLPSDAFDATGLFSLLWQNRIETATDSTMGMVEQLLSLECPGELDAG